MHRLIPHPDTPAPFVTAIEVTTNLSEAGDLTLTYTLAADLKHLRIPEPTPPTRADDLWRHTCFEAFIQGDDAPAYREFNLSPSGQWQAYAFVDYRRGGPLAPAPAPTMKREDSANSLTLVCTLPAEAVPRGRLLRLGLTAVVEAVDGSLSYWSLRHAPGKPDFHHTHAFALSLERP
ncbi:MAG: DOMON-like domain-containing protein [Pseudomonadota bacterium]